MSIVLIILLVVFGVPLLLIWGFFHVVTLSFEKLGLSPEAAVAVLILMLAGSLVNIPLSRRRYVEVQETRFFGFVRKNRLKALGLSINIGGAVIPIILAAYFLSFVPIEHVMLPVMLMTGVSYWLARYVPGKGIVLPIFLPAILAALIAFVLSPDFAAPVAFISGVFGIIVGADIMRLPRVMRQGQGIMSIGGAGVFDGIFLIAIVAALLTSF